MSAAPITARFDPDDHELIQTSWTRILADEPLSAVARAGWGMVLCHLPA